MEAGGEPARRRSQIHDAGKQVLASLLEEAQEVPLEGVFSLKDVSRDLRVLFEEGIQPGADTGWLDFDKLCTFELGRLCVITGVPGSGKSEFTDELVMRLNVRHGWKAAFFSPENMPLTYHLRKLMEKATGQPFEVGLMPEPEYCRAERYIQENFSFILPEEDFTVDHILDIARELVRKQGVRILSVDPFNRFEHQVPPGQTETQYISAVLDRFTNFALRNNCLVILVAHPRKM
ncbi:DNA primase, partial [Bacteroides sp. 51]|nr:DNA primase [Bacteroides sp. 51]